MTSVRVSSGAFEAHQQHQIRQWIEELTDFTPQQVDAVLQKMRQQQAKGIPSHVFGR